LRLNKFDINRKKKLNANLIKIRYFSIHKR
jgi:hypothetical protein